MSGTGKCYVVIRKAVLMEDEGSDKIIQTFADKAEAEEWIKSQEGQYFRPSDYYIQCNR